MATPYQFFRIIHLALWEINSTNSPHLVNVPTKHDSIDDNHDRWHGFPNDYIVKRSLEPSYGLIENCVRANHFYRFRWTYFECQSQWFLCTKYLPFAFRIENHRTNFPHLWWLVIDECKLLDKSITASANLLNLETTFFIRLRRQIDHSSLTEITQNESNNKTVSFSFEYYTRKTRPFYSLSSIIIISYV